MDNNDARVKWPGGDRERADDPDANPWAAAEVLSWLASEGLAASAIGPDLSGFMFEDGEINSAARWRYMANIQAMFHAHDTFLALSALREVDPAKADEVAHRIVLAAVCGDSYGEWLWEWARDLGLDADAIADQARERVRDPNTRG